MFRRARRFAWLTLLLTAAPLLAGPAEELHERVRQWLELRRELAARQAQWQTEQAVLQDELALLRTDQARLDAELALARASLQIADTASSQATHAYARDQVALDTLANDLVAAEAELAAWDARLTGPLLAAWQEARTAAAAAHPGDTPAARTARLLAGHQALAELNRRVHVGHLLLVGPDGQERDTLVLFLGLGAGFAAPPQGLAGAVGRPDAKGWTWTWRDDLGPAVRQAIAVARKDQAATLVRLPLQVQEAPP
jgi:hypothetical protein